MMTIATGIELIRPPIIEFGFRVCAKPANELSTNEAVGMAMSANFPISRLVYNMRR